MLIVSAGVENSPAEQLFILLVVTIMPWAAIFVGWKWGICKGAALFSLSMAASFLFGFFFHSVIESPDLHSNVVSEHRDIFFHSAVILSLLEFFRVRAWALCLDSPYTIGRSRDIPELIGAPAPALLESQTEFDEKKIAAMVAVIEDGGYLRCTARSSISLPNEHVVIRLKRSTIG